LELFFADKHATAILLQMAGLPYLRSGVRAMGSFRGKSLIKSQSM
jgi:hypothetical protein